MRIICQTLIRLYNSNINGNDLDRLPLYLAYFKDISQYNQWVRATNFHNSYLVKAYISNMNHQLVFQFVDAQNRVIPNGTLESNPGVTVYDNLIHVFGVHGAPFQDAYNYERPASLIISSLP
jgi:hypothetical protein